MGEELDALLRLEQVFHSEGPEAGLALLYLGTVDLLDLLGGRWRFRV